VSRQDSAGNIECEAEDRGEDERCMGSGEWRT
jgi:hypothetical protein